MSADIALTETTFTATFEVTIPDGNILDFSQNGDISGTHVTLTADSPYLPIMPEGEISPDGRQIQCTGVKPGEPPTPWNGSITCDASKMLGTAADPDGNTVVWRLTRTTLKCEDAVAKDLVKLAVCFRKCHIKQADMAAKGKVFDEAACETGSGKPVSCRGKYDTTSQALIAKGICPACLDVAGQSNLADSLTSALETEEGNVYCSGTSTFGDDDSGFVPPDKNTGKCEDAVTNALSAFATCVGSCEIKQEDLASKGMPFDRSACESVGTSACRTKYGAASGKLEPRPGKEAICPPCLDMTNRANLADAVQNFLDQQQGQIYCADTASPQ